MGYKTDKTKSEETSSIPKPAEDATWDSLQGQELLAMIPKNLTPYQVAVLFKYKELFPTGMGGFEQIMKQAERSVKKKW